MLGVYFATGDQHFDHRSIQDHYGNRTASDLLYKGVLKDRSRTIYSGNVIIRQGAHECDAYQTNRNILLSEHAKADSIPNLEILSNDPVRCGHAASVGPVDEDTLFYIQSRGIPFEEARAPRRVRVPPGGARPGHAPRDPPRPRAGHRRRAGSRGARRMSRWVEAARTLRRPRGRGPEGGRRADRDGPGQPGRGDLPGGGRHLLARRVVPVRGRGRPGLRDDRMPPARVDLRPANGQPQDASRHAPGPHLAGPRGGGRGDDRPDDREEV